MIRLLVSARSVDEALAAAGAGADFIDLKDPSAGALGGLPPASIAAIVPRVRLAAPAARISATVGDFEVDDLPDVLERAAAVAAAGVDDVKVGVVAGRHAAGWLRGLMALGIGPARLVPVLLADEGVDAELLQATLAVLSAAHAGPVPAAVMLDTTDKRRGSLLQRVPAGSLRAFVNAVRALPTPGEAGLAGALRLDDVPGLRTLAPDFAGFRSAVCAGDRTGALDAARVRVLHQRLTAPVSPGEAARAVVRV